MIEFVIALIWLIVWLIVIPAFFLTPFIEQTNGERVRAQLHQQIVDKGGLNVRVTPHSRRWFHYIVEYQDSEGYLHRATCRAKLKKGKLIYSWTSASKTFLHANLTVDYGQLHEEVKLLRIKYGDDLFVEMSDKERAVWDEVGDRQYKGAI
ncbi:MAG: hypothetical protein AAF614_42815 [Chloroflexota bacterium]